MSSQPSGGAERKGSVTSGGGSGTCDPVMRNALRYTISAREYATLHKYILSRSKVLRKATPTPTAVEKALQPKDTPPGVEDYNVKTIRHALRVFVAAWVGKKGWDAVLSRLGRGEYVLHRYLNNYCDES